ncbi:MAG: T9SS type A sorting domain-containing protein, partial [Bacteroidales bacterium]|nr:T9SS type A sorting domain-containing protein [Bacteroidales bacterium]
VTNLNGYYMNYNGQEGLVVDWEDPVGAVTILLYVDGEPLGEVPAGTHPIFLGFEGEVPEYTFEIGAVAVHADCESEMVTTQVYYDDVNENEIITALFPNPTNGNVTIQAMGMTRITVVNTLGQVVYDTELKADEYILNMSQFTAGMYMVRVSTVNGVAVKRVTVMQ